MYKYRKLDKSMSFLLVFALAILPNCSGDVSGTGTQIGSVTVSVTPTMLLVGGVAQASVQDAAGHPIAGDMISWVSLTPSIATVSSSGGVTAVAPGSAQIQATVGQETGVATVMVPDLAGHDFDDGTLSQYYTNPYGVDLDFLDVLTISGTGRLARFHYAGSNQDRNRALAYRHAVGFGQTLYFRGEFFIAASDLNTPSMGRKLLYWQPHGSYAKYGGAGGPNFYTIVGTNGNDKLWIDATYIDQPGTAHKVAQSTGASLLPNHWHLLEQQLSMESVIGAGDGVMRVWLDGVLVYENTAVHLSDPNWIGQAIPGGNGTPLELADVYFENFLVGQQVNSPGVFDEYRYWDNVAFSTKRIGQ